MKSYINLCPHCDSQYIEYSNFTRMYTCLKCNQVFKKAKNFTALREKCARCNYKEFKSALHVHHINSDRRNNSLENLVVLCSNCHNALHHEEWSLVEIGLRDPEPSEKPLPLYERIGCKEAQAMIDSLGIRFR